MEKYRTQHYWRIHRKVTQKTLKNMDRWEREKIANDAAHETFEFKRFETYINSETERLYNDPENPYNDASTFKIEYREKPKARK